MWKHFLCIMSMLLTLTAWGCSLAPQPVARPVTGQQTLEAVDHWRILAQQIVKEMQLTTGSSVYVSEQDRSPFGRAFTTLLRHEVAASGARLSGAREGSLCIDWGVQIIKYSEPRPDHSCLPGDHRRDYGRRNRGWLHYQEPTEFMAGCWCRGSRAFR